MDKISSRPVQRPTSLPSGLEGANLAPLPYAATPGLYQADGAGQRKALLFALRGRIADIVPRAATGSTAMPQQAAYPAAASPGGMVRTPSVCSFSPAEPRDDPKRLGFGIAAIDGRLPAGGLAAASLNEFKPATPRDAATVLALTLTLAARAGFSRRPLLLVLSGRTGAEHGLPYGPGLVRLGLDPGRLLVAQAPQLADALWALEDGLRSGVLAAVIGLIDTGRRAIGLVPARRLVLAANEGGTPCLLMTGADGESISVAHSRWRVQTLPSAPHPLDPAAPGARRCTLRLERCRHGPAGLDWGVEWSDAGQLIEAGARPPHGVERKHALMNR